MLDKLYKLMFDLSICYTVGAFLLSYAAGITGYGGAFLFLMLGILSSVLLHRYRRGSILSLIIVPCLHLIFWRPSFPELLVYLLIWTFLIYETVSERFTVGRDGFADRLKHLLYLSLLLVIPMIISYPKFIQAAWAASPYLIGALVSAVFLLRHLRAVNQMEQMKQYQWQQLAEFSVFLVVCLILTLVRAPQNLMLGLRQVYSYLVQPLLSFLATFVIMLVYGIIRLILSIAGTVTDSPKIIEYKIKFGEPMKQRFENNDMNADASWLEPLLYSLGCILSLVLLFLFFRWLLGERLNGRIPPGIQETREYISIKKNKSSSGLQRKAPGTPQAAVRYYYGKYLRLLHRRKLQIGSQNTTREIHEKHIALLREKNEINQAAAAGLKHIYRKARYQSTEEITPKEAEDAKKQYREIKSLLP
jgi:hypothetical protein